MRRQMIENAALEVAVQVRTVEDTIDEALAEIAELQGRMVRARAATGIGVLNSHEAFEKLAGAVQSLVVARGAMANCHSALAEAQARVPGLRTVAFGDGYECPKPTSELRIVA